MYFNMKFKNLFTKTVNKANSQYNFSLKKKELKKIGMTPEQLLESTFLKPKIKFNKLIKGVKK